MRIKKAVIPAAGLGTRLLPATKVVPKELLPVAGRPLIEYAIEEAAASGIEVVVIVVGPGKELIRQHFSFDKAVEISPARITWSAEADQAEGVSRRVEIRTVWQQVPTGLASAVTLAQPEVGDEPFVVILPDALIHADVPCSRQLINCYNAHGACVIATQAVAANEVERFGIVETDQELSPNTRISRVRRCLERPALSETKSRTGIFGRYVLLPEIFDCISRLAPGRGGEFQLTDALSLYRQSAPVYAYQFTGEHFDAGNKVGLTQANVKYALNDPATAAPVLDYLASLDLPVGTR